MFKSLWATGIAALVAGSVLLTPATSEAQRRGNRGWRGGGERYEHRGYDRDFGGWGGGYGYGGYGYGGYGLGSAYSGGWYSPGYSSYSYPSYSTYDYGTPTYYGATQFSSSPQYSYYADSQSGYGGQAAMSNPNGAMFTVRIADPNAQIWFQDYQTQQRGTVRRYESGALDPNSTYTFTVRAKWMENGKQMDQTRHVNARAGQNQTVTFGSSMGQREQIPTNPQRQPVSDELNNQQFNNNQPLNNDRRLNNNQRFNNNNTPNTNSSGTRLPSSPTPNNQSQNNQNQQGSVLNPPR